MKHERTLERGERIESPPTRGRELKHLAFYQPAPLPQSPPPRGGVKDAQVVCRNRLAALL